GQPQLEAHDPLRRRRALAHHERPVQPRLPARRAPRPAAVRRRARRALVPRCPAGARAAPARAARPARPVPRGPPPGRLAAGHADAAGDPIAFDDGLVERLSVGYGRLASGPVTLLRRYADVAGGHGVETNLIVTGAGRSGLHLLELGDSFAVAERFSLA